MWIVAEQVVAADDHGLAVAAPRAAQRPGWRRRSAITADGLRSTAVSASTPSAPTSIEARHDALQRDPGRAAATLRPTRPRSSSARSRPPASQHARQRAASRHTQRGRQRLRAESVGERQRHEHHRQRATSAPAAPACRRGSPDQDAQHRRPGDDAATPARRPAGQRSRQHEPPRARRRAIAIPEQSSSRLSTSPRTPGACRSRASSNRRTVSPTCTVAGRACASRRDAATVGGGATSTSPRTARSPGPPQSRRLHHLEHLGRDAPAQLAPPRPGGPARRATARSSAARALEGRAICADDGRSGSRPPRAVPADEPTAASLHQALVELELGELGPARIRLGLVGVRPGPR